MEERRSGYPLYAPGAGGVQATAIVLDDSQPGPYEVIWE